MIRSRARIIRPLAPLLAALLAACATAPSPKPSSAPQPVMPDQSPAAAATLPTSPPAREPAAPGASTSEPWNRLRASFAMADCDGDPSIQAWAHRLTANPRRFEQRLAQSLPRLRFIQDVAEKHQVAGEFVLLPWVESRYLPVRGRGRQPAGMWQIVPATAGSLGLRVNRHFDGRMDMAAATAAVMTMLRRYQDQFQDWRLTDYAYNAGEFTVRKLVARHGAPPEQPLIPRLPIKKVTREHLVKLLAIACVIREPDRFQVRLPTLAEEQHLVAVPIEHPMSMANAAKQAGMSIDALRDYNAAFLNNRIDPTLARTLMLPNSRVDQFTQAMREAGASEDASAPSDPAPAGKAPSHMVRPGESLWLIAKRAGVGVKQLRRWNGLRDNRVHPGQVLQLAAPE